MKSKRNLNTCDYFYFFVLGRKRPGGGKGCMEYAFVDKRTNRLIQLVDLDLLNESEREELQRLPVWEEIEEEFAW